NAKPSGSGGDKWELLQTKTPTNMDRLHSIVQTFSNHKKIKFVFKSLSGTHLVPNMTIRNPAFYFTGSTTYKRYGIRFNHIAGSVQTLVDTTSKSQWNLLSAAIAASSYPHWEMHGEIIFEKKSYKGDAGFG